MIETLGIFQCTGQTQSLGGEHFTLIMMSGEPNNIPILFHFLFFPLKKLHRMSVSSFVRTTEDKSPSMTRRDHS